MMDDGSALWDTDAKSGSPWWSKDELEENLKANRTGLPLGGCRCPPPATCKERCSKRSCESKCPAVPSSCPATSKCADAEARKACEDKCASCSEPCITAIPDNKSWMPKALAKMARLLQVHSYGR